MTYDNRAELFLASIRYEHLVAGLSGGVISTLVTHPFDLLKIRFATHDGSLTNQRPKYQGLIHAVRTIVKQDGFTGLYRGSSANIVGAGSSWGLYFFLYNAFKFQAQDGDLTLQLSPLMHMMLASCAGIITLTAINPVWVVKTRLCLPNTDSIPSHLRYKGLLDGLVNLYKYEGIRGLYKGYLPGIIGTSHGTVQFMVYEELKKAYCNWYGLPITTILDPLSYIAMAATSKAVAASVTYPYQVVRARLQDQEQKYRGVMDTINRTWRYEGIYGFYKGLTPNLIKVVPATCITFVVYEYMSHLMLSNRTSN